MSYILDALRRADAERERDPARGIHAQPGTGVPAQARARVPAWGWAAGAFVVLAAAGIVGWLRPVPPPPVAAMPTATPVATAAPAAVPRPAPALVVPVAAAVMPPPPPALPEPVRAAPPAVAPAPRVVAPAPVARVAAAPAAAAATVAKAATPASSGAAPAAERVYNVAELPMDVQGQLPKLVISGAVHSDNAAQRMLIVNGQVVNEGAELAPGVVLEQIRARNAVLRFRGYRYSVGY